LLRRIPAVKWAFSRFRPLPHSGSTETALIAADESAVIVESDIHVSDDSSGAMLPEASVLSDIDSESAEDPELISSSDRSAELPTDVEPVAEETLVSSIDLETASVDVPEVTSDNESSPSVALQIEPVLANDPPPVTSVAAEHFSADSPTVDASTEAELVPAPAPEIRKAPKARARAAEPVDRTMLIRQRWAETGIRMWNPRLHGTGDATLNIQGCVELLPPESGETMPRYDKLEFKMLGGQIVCEGVIVDAPAQADKRSFTRLAEPRNTERPREPVRERQTALA